MRSTGRSGTDDHAYIDHTYADFSSLRQHPMRAASSHSPVRVTSIIGFIALPSAILSPSIPAAMTDASEDPDLRFVNPTPGQVNVLRLNADACSSCGCLQSVDVRESVDFVLRWIPRSIGTNAHEAAARVHLSLWNDIWQGRM